MARKAHPWYWQERGLWMVNINGVRHQLGDHPEGAPRPTKSKKTGLWNVPKAIEEAFDKIKGVKPPAGDETDFVNTVFQAFLDWSKENRGKRTHDRYFDFLNAFDERWPGLTVGQINASHVTTWLNEQKAVGADEKDPEKKKRRGWGPTTKRNAITALQRAFNWAVKNFGLKLNPIKGMEKPEARTRTTVVPPEEFAQLLENVTDQPFRELLILSYDSGARPQEIKGLEARHVRLEEHRAVLPTEEAKGERAPRAIYFPTERSMEIVTRLAKERPTGLLLLNNGGNPWTGYAVKLRFERLEKKIGRRLFHYALRHSFITRKLLAGVDSHVVASLAGHRDTGMIDRVYSHVAQDHSFMLAEAQKDIIAANASRAAGKPSAKAGKNGKTPSKRQRRPR